MIPIQGESLKVGDTIALVVPASWCDGFDETSAALKERGFQVKLPRNFEERFGYLAGTDEERAQALMEAWKDVEVKAIWCIRGGYETRLLGHPLNCRYALDGDTGKVELLEPGVAYTKLPLNQ